MRQTIIWLAILIIPLGIVGGMEKRYQALDAELDQTVQQYERWIDVVVEDAARLEAELAKSRLYRSKPHHQDDITSREFLQLLADYMSADGRCKVVIENWSTWKGARK